MASPSALTLETGAIYKMLWPRPVGGQATLEDVHECKRAGVFLINTFYLASDSAWLSGSCEKVTEMACGQAYFTTTPYDLGTSILA